jgi:hypothetical protein
VIVIVGVAGVGCAGRWVVNTTTPPQVTPLSAARVRDVRSLVQPGRWEYSTLNARL